MITLLINYESFSRILSPVSINFAEAIPIVFLGPREAGAVPLVVAPHH
jgi:hypothetical protein